MYETNEDVIDGTMHPNSFRSSHAPSRVYERVAGKSVGDELRFIVC